MNLTWIFRLVTILLLLISFGFMLYAIFGLRDFITSLVMVLMTIGLGDMVYNDIEKSTGKTN